MAQSFFYVMTQGQQLRWRWTKIILMTTMLLHCFPPQTITKTDCEKLRVTGRRMEAHSVGPLSRVTHSKWAGGERSDLHPSVGFKIWPSREQFHAELTELYKNDDRERCGTARWRIKKNCGFETHVQLSAMETEPPPPWQGNLIQLEWLDICFQVCKSAKVMWLWDNNRMVIEIHAALYLRKWLSASRAAWKQLLLCVSRSSSFTSARLALPACLYSPLLDSCL